MGGYDDLVEPDERTLRFMPGGLGMGIRLSADDAVTFQRATVEQATIADPVPDDLRIRFERLRARHVQGVVDYHNFAGVANDAIRLYEPALRARFLEYYRGAPIPFVDRNGAPAPVTATSYDRVYDHIRSRKVNRIAGQDGPIGFNGTLDGLLRWARTEKLLRGQRARHFERSIQKLRNDISHDGGYQIETPVTAAREIHDLAEFINQLWGWPTPGGRLYPAPVVREVLALGLVNGIAATLARAATLTGPGDGSVQWILLRGDWNSRRWAHFDSRYMTTAVPMDYLWGPGDTDAAIGWLDSEQSASDTVDVVDQLMLVHHRDTRLYLPQRPELATALTPIERSGRWYLMLADDPLAAFACVRARINDPAGHGNDCGCSASCLAQSGWRAIYQKILAFRPHFAPSALPPDVRAEDRFRMPPRFVEVGSQAT